MDYSRRDFVKLSAIGAVASLIPGVARAQPRARAEFVTIRRNVGFFTERGGTVGWLVNDDGVVIIDSQFADTAPLLLEGLRQRTSRQIDVLINTHHHPDHVGGNAVLRPVARSIVAHSRAAENQRRVAREGGNEDERAFPDSTFDDRWSIEIGDEVVRARYYGPAHTGGDAAIFFERANVVHLGDLLNNRGFPYVDAPAGASVHSWIEVLETIAAEHSDETVFVYGHSEAGFPVTGSRADLYYQRDYFSAVIDVARRALEEGRSRAEAVEITSLPGFDEVGGTPSRLGLGIGAAYDELIALNDR